MLLPTFLLLLVSFSTSLASGERDGTRPSSSTSPSNFPRSLATLKSSPKRFNASQVVLSPLLLVSTIDGALHALERATGKKVWSVEGLGGGVDGFAMVGSEGSSFEDPKDWKEGDEEEKFVVDPKKGEIWVGRRAWVGEEERAGGWKFSKLAVTVPDLVHASSSFQASPIRFAQDLSGRIFTGKMESSLFGIELDTGKIVGEFGSTPSSRVQSAESVVPSSCGVGGHGLGRTRRRKKSGDAEMDAAEMEAMLDEMESGHSKHAESCPQNLLYITRTDYTLRIHSESTSYSRSTQTLRYSTYGPPDPGQLDPSLTAIWGQGATADNHYAMLATRWSSGDRKLSAGVLGILPGGKATRFWAVEMPESLPIAFFDVLSLRSSGITASAPSSFILPQPLPSPSDLIKTSSATSSSQKVLFIGRTSTSSSSLFALSKENYPGLGDPDVDSQPGQGRRRIDLEGYHYLEDSGGQGARELLTR